MAIVRRKKYILEGISTVTIDSIEEKKHENGKIYFIITVGRKSDGATRQFWIGEDSYVIEKIIDVIFGEDEREEFDTNDFIGKEIIIDVKKGNRNYFNITNVRSVDKFECDDDNLDLDIDNLDLDIDDVYDQDDNLDLDIDNFINYDEEDEDFLSKRLVDRGFR